MTYFFKYDVLYVGNILLGNLISVHGKVTFDLPLFIDPEYSTGKGDGSGFQPQPGWTEPWHETAAGERKRTTSGEI